MEVPSYEKLTIYEVDKVKELFSSLVQNLTEDLELNLKNIQKIDMSGIQLLLATQKSCQLQNKNMILSHINENIKKDLELCGCMDLLGVSDE